MVIISLFIKKKTFLLKAKSINYFINFFFLVSEFSKKTGDYTSLSATDIKVIALTYRYERERVGTDHLKKEPEKKKEIVDSSIKRPEDYNNLPMGFYVPNANVSV